jgi:predicted negative regulator of RcsB-dependent stress response
MKTKRNSLRDVISGAVLLQDWFRGQYKLIVMVSVLIFMYIYCGYQSQRQQKQLSDLQKELQDTQMVRLTVSSELVDKTRQSSISAMLQANGSKVKESRTPAIRIQ